MISDQVKQSLLKNELILFASDFGKKAVAESWTVRMSKQIKKLDQFKEYENVNIEQYKNKFIKVVVVNKKDLYQFDRFTDRLLQEQTHEVKIVEDFSDLDAENVSDDIVENTQDTTTLLEKYIDELDVDLDKKRLKNTMKALYLEACDLEL